MPSKTDSRLWTLASNITKCIVQCLCKLWLETLNTTKVVNKETFLKLTKSREPGRGLVTVSNHHSFWDDPLLWGDGVYQEAMNQILDKVNTGQWVHIFPEGSVNEKKVRWRLKWGVSRIIADADVTPIVLPIYHIGLDTISPIKTPNRLRVGKTVTIVIGEPIDYTDEVTRMKECQMSSDEILKAITDDIEEKFYLLKEEAERVHFPCIGLTFPRGVSSQVDEKLSAAKGTDVTSQPSSGR